MTEGKEENHDAYLHAAEKAFAYNGKVWGHIIHLDDTRFVFLGKHEDVPGEWHLGFRNADGDDTRLKLSPEALGALTNLFSKPRKSDTVNFPMVIKTTWQVTVTDKTPEPTVGETK